MFILAAPALAAPAAVELSVTVDEALVVASQAFPESPCAGRIVIVVDDTISERRPGVIAEALGRQFVDGAWQTVDCRIGVEPDFLQCDVIVHEAGHLAGIDGHTEHGVMSANPEPFPACHPMRNLTRRELAVSDIVELLPRRAWRVSCNARVTRCSATAPRTRYVRYFTVARDASVSYAGMRAAAE